MILTKKELIRSLNGEIRLLLHLISKGDSAQLDYRPTPKQRSTIEVLQYLSIFGPIHLNAILADTFDMDAWRSSWTSGKAASKELNLDQAQAAIAGHATLYAERIEACSDERLSEEFEMFGQKSTRAAWIISLVLCHYSAYRMQLFLYLKSSGQEELNTMNLWVGMDGKM